MEPAGPVELSLGAASSAIDTSWIATLQDIDSSGRAVDSTAGWLRGSLRAVDERASTPGRPVHSFDHVEPVVLNERVSYRIGLVDNARRFAAGHRIRLVLTSDDSLDGAQIMGFPHAPLGLPSRNTIFSSSRLMLPILEGADVLATVFAT